MKVKKILAIALALLVLTCMFTACGSTVEHRFDDTAYSAQAEATMRTISQNLSRVENLLNSHGVELYAAFASYEDGKPGRPAGSVSDTAITAEALDNWAAQPGRKLCFYTESGETIESYLAVWQKQIQTAYGALNTLSSEQWNHLEGKTLSMIGMLVKSGEKLYVETSMACE